MENGRSRRANGGATLTILKGSNAGSEFKLQEGETTIGRQSDCDIVVSDIAVSRKHASVTLEGGKYILRDLGSGNGTFVSEEKISQAGEVLSDGMVFKVGDTEISFSQTNRRGVSARHISSESRDVGATARGSRRRRSDQNSEDASDVSSGRRRGGGKGEESAKKKSKVKTILMGFVFVGIIAGFAVFLMNRNEQMSQERALSEAHQELVEGIRNQMAEAIEKGRRASRAGKFRDAIQQFEAADKIVQEARETQNLSENELSLPPDVARNLAYSKKELANQELIEKSQSQASAGHLTGAVETLRGIPEDSYFDHDRIEEVKKEFAKYFPPFIEEARKQLSAKRFDEAQEAVEEVLAVDRNFSEAKAVQAEIDRAAALAKRPVKKKAVAPEEKADPTQGALQIFYSGQIDGAIAAAKECEDPACARLVKKLSDFSDAFMNVESNTGAAFDALMAIPGARKSTYYKAIGGKMATTMTKTGIAEMGNQNYAAAFKSFQQVMKIDPENAVARKHLGTIHQKAQEMFQQAYVGKGVDAEGSRRNFERVMSMTSPEDELHQKAKRHMQQLSGGY